MTNIEDIYNDPCQKLDAWCVDAYFSLSLNPDAQSTLVLDNSWGETSIDLTPAIQAGETITHLLLTESALQYNREDYGRTGAADGGIDCINGDDLSHIISMKYLKDVNQTTAPANGDIYMFNGSTGQFDTFGFGTWMGQVNGQLATHAQNIASLQSGLDNLNNTVLTNYNTLNNKIDTVQANLQSQITANANSIASLRADLTALQSSYNTFVTNTNNRLSAIESTIAKPTYAPSDAVIAWGNIDVEYNANPTGKGLYTHNPNTNVSGDMRFQ